MFKRGGVWWTCIRINDKKVQKSLDTVDKKLAKAIEAKIRVQIAEGKYFEKPKGDLITVNELIDKYLEEHSKPNKKPKSYKDDINFVKKIRKHFGNKKLSEVSPRHISKYISARRKDGVGNSCINHELCILRHAYNLAIRNWELIEKSPFSKISIPKADKKRVRYLFEDEEKRLFAILPEWLLPIVIIARETGLRLSNSVNLCWSQVNLFSKIIIIETTKNGDPVGIPMSENVFNTLKKLSKIREIDSDYIFCNKNTGKPFGHYWVSKSFSKVCKKAEIENFRFHDLRHDFCSKLVQKGVDLYTVASLAGHKDIKVTQRYAHLHPENLRSAINVLNSDYNLTTVDKKQVVLKI